MTVFPFVGARISRAMAQPDSARRAESNVVAASAFVITKLDLVPIRAPFAARKAKAARLTRIQKGRFEDGLFAN